MAHLISSLLFIISCVLITASSGIKSLPLRNDSSAIQLGSSDYGNLVHEPPSSVLFPRSIKDVIDLIKLSNSRANPFTVAARGRGHSVRGQAMARGGVVVDMTSLDREKRGEEIKIGGNSSLGFYADVGGEQLWINVLQATLKHRLSPVAWTDYLYLSVGGTLSNAGISGQAFLHGPQINNVVELDVITGKGEFITCSKTTNRELFFSVLGGLGQFGIITRARIVLAKAPTRVKWAIVIYSNFSTYTADQLRLISGEVPNYVEGFLIVNENITAQWRSSFSTPSNQYDIAKLLKEKGILYSIEIAKYYDNQTAGVADKEFQKLLKQLNFIPRFIFSADVSYFDFLSRVGNLDNIKGPPQSHPWLNLFIPSSRVSEINAGVFTTMVPKLNQSSGVYIFYPTYRNKWDDRMSAVIPDEDIFYGLSLLHTSCPDNAQFYESFNNRILQFCKEKRIKVKQYLASYKSEQDWIEHYGIKWRIIKERKAKFDPKFILSPGQGIFNSS